MATKTSFLVLLGVSLLFSASLYAAQDIPTPRTETARLPEISTLHYDGLTLDFGLRIQGRFAYDDATGNQDMMLRRSRIKAMGQLYEFGTYYLELRADNINQDQAAASVQLEAGYLDLTLAKEHSLMVGLYDVPFSRGLLTGDSRLLFMDRGVIIDQLSNLGLVDNTVGVMAHGRPGEGRFEYAIGLSDNRAFDADASSTPVGSNQLMPAGRLVINLLDPAPAGGYADYRATYIGQGERLSLGVNVASLGDAFEGADTFDILALGFDIFGNLGPWTYQGEYDTVQKSMTAGSGVDYDTSGWYLQTGYLLPLEIALSAGSLKLEPTLRYQQLDPNSELSGDGSRWTSVGLNAYLKGHNLKLQMDFTVKDEEGPEIANNTFMVQMQLDF
jgi:Phosphate-selective porin O and P